MKTMSSKEYFPPLILSCLRLELEEELLAGSKDLFYFIESEGQEIGGDYTILDDYWEDN